MKKKFISTFAILAMSLTAAASEPVKKEESKKEEVAPYKCTGTLLVYKNGNPLAIDIQVVVSNDPTTDKDCGSWVQGQADALQKKLGSGYSVKNSYNFI